MRRLFSAALAVMMTFVAYTASAQIKVSEEDINKRIAKAEQASVHPKKSLKGSTWIDLGDAYYDAVTATTSGLYVEMPEATAKLMYGAKVKAKKAEADGVAYSKYAYEYFDAYFANGMLAFWDTKIVFGGEGALDKAIAAYEMAVEKDPTVKETAIKKISAIADHYKALAGHCFAAGKHEDAAAEFINSYNVSISPVLNKPDTVTIYNAGYLYTAKGNFPEAIKALDEAAKYEYYGKEGESFYYRGLSYTDLKDYPAAKTMFLEGLTKFPSNNRNVDGLMSLYVTTGDDMSEIVPYLEAAIAVEPDNHVYYDGLGRIYDKLGDDDKSLSYFFKSAELAPEDFAAQFNLAMLYIRKANGMYDVIREIPNASEEDYANALVQQTDYFRLSLAPLEKAHVLRPESVSTLETLKNITFRLREEEGIMDKYNKYSEALKVLQQ